MSSLSVAAFYVQALAIETEASERYALLADQMDVHNNREIAGIFRKMAQIEAHHHDEIAQQASDANVATASSELPSQPSWTGPSGPEAVDFEDLHYLMTPHQALELARASELRAVRFFEAIAATNADPQVRKLAAEFAGEERQHVAWVDEWLAKFAEPAKGWDDDPDPPVYSE